MELDNASRSEQWRTRDACDRTQPIGVDVKNGEEERNKKSRVEPRMMVAGVVRGKQKKRTGNAQFQS